MHYIVTVRNRDYHFYHFQDAKIPLSPLQIEELINALDQDGDGEIDFR